MNKITVIPILPGDQKFDWNKQEYEPGKERLAYGKPVEITDEEIVDASREYAKLQFPYPEQVGQRAHIRDAYMAAYEFIKNQINPKR